MINQPHCEWETVTHSLLANHNYTHLSKWSVHILSIHSMYVFFKVYIYPTPETCLNKITTYKFKIIFVSVIELKLGGISMLCGDKKGLNI